MFVTVTKRKQITFEKIGKDPYQNQYSVIIKGMTEVFKAELFRNGYVYRFGHSATLMMTEICTFSQKCLGSKHMGMLYNRAFMENSSGKRIFV